MEISKRNESVKFDFLIIITSLLITCYLTANIMAVKLVEIFGVTWFDAGTITFPIAYILGDVLTEVWGFKTAKRVIYLAFICNLILVLATYIGTLLPGAESLGDVNEAYSLIFSYTPRILFASMLAFIFGSLSNAWAMEFIKKITGKKWLFVRTITSSAIGYIFDTVIFVVVAFAGTVAFDALISMILAQYVIKLLIESFFATPFVYTIIDYVREKSGVEHAREHTGVYVNV